MPQGSAIESNFEATQVELMVSLLKVRRSTEFNKLAPTSRSVPVLPNKPGSIGMVAICLLEPAALLKLGGTAFATDKILRWTGMDSA